ncbi:MAG: glycosyltransferase family 2 protein [Fibrobacterota bacterium]
MKNVSVVIPFLNEAESLRELTERITAALASVPVSAYEIIYVNDGSTDGSVQIVKELAKQNRNIKLISFRKNYGKAAALAVGFAAAQYECIVSMDADLQDDPVAIPDMLALLDQGYDLVSGWKKKRYDSPLFTLPSRVWNSFTSRIAGIRLHDFNCGFKAYRAAAAQCLDIYGERHRYLPVFAHWNGFKVTEMPVPHHARKYGKSKYGVDKFVKGSLDLLTIIFLRRYTKNPMHLFGLFGVLFILLGFSITGYFGAVWLVQGSLHLRPLMLLGVGAFLMGIQLFSIGLICEMITHTAKREEYLIESKTNLD